VNSIPTSIGIIMLIIFGGLPGTGKTTISKEVAKRLKAVYLRVDTIEQTLLNLDDNRDSFVVGSEGYLIGYAIAKENLALGFDVIADSVNAIAITRHDWRQVANDANTVFVEIELICSDKKTHQDRVEGRVPDIDGHKLPTWKDVLSRDYEPWESISILVDTSRHTVDESVQKIIEYIKSEV
jgi:predicted kinase